MSDPLVTGTRVVGKRLPRVDAVDKVTGAAKYTGDYQPRGLLHAAMLRSPHAHARILSMDTDRAQRLPGVKAVFTHLDVPRSRHAGQPEPRAGSLVRDQYILDTTVRFHGDGVAAVAAASPEIAEEALGLIRVEYEVLPAVFDAYEAMLAGAPSLHGTEHNLVIPPVIITSGDLEKGFAQADHVFEGVYTTSRHVPAFMEPYTCTVVPGGAGRLTVYSSTQAPFMVRGTLSEVLGIPMSRIRVVTEHMGGGFGAKQDLYQHEYLTALLALHTGEPVRFEFSRAETFIAGRSRHPVTVELKQGVTRDGILTARRGRYIANSGAYGSHGPGITWVGCAALGSLHRCEHVHIEGLCVYTNAPIAGAFRGYGAPQAYFALETQMDEIAEALDIDPLDLRKRNAIRPGDIGPAGTPFTNNQLPLCLDRGAARIGWQRRSVRVATTHGAAAGATHEGAPGIPAGNSHTLRGIGVASQLHSATAYPETREIANAAVAVNEDGTVQLRIGSADLGTGAKTVLAQICAETLGVCYEDISVLAGDTDLVPYDLGAYASRTTYIAGGAVDQAAAEARTKLLKLASEKLGVPLEDLSVQQGLIRIKGRPQAIVPIGQIVGAEQGTPAEQITGAACNQPLNAYSFAAQFAEVEVDTETGQVRVVRMVAVHDIGRAINPAAAEGQVEGGLHQGIGYALMEDMVIDPRTGRTLNPNFVDYKLLTSLDMPEVEVEFVETGPGVGTAPGVGPYGAKGVAEDALCPTAPAITNAVFNATGVRITRLPVDPEHLLAALRKAQDPTHPSPHL
jgi:CO/xanthine dehydrogenase Mo-binding subunit